MRLILIALAAAMLAAPATAHSESAPLLSLLWLKKQQTAKGQWAGGTAPSSLALLSYLGAGHTHRYGRFRDNVKGILRHMLKSQTATGELSKDSREHALATLALCEAYGMTKSPLLKGAAIKAATNLVERTKTKIAWGAMGPEGLPPTGAAMWAAAALRSAKVAGIEVPGLAGALKAGREYARTELADGTARPAVMAAMLHFARGGKNADVDKLARRLVANAKAESAKMEPLEHYAATILMFSRGGEDWKAWNRHIKKRLVDSQVRGHTAKDRGAWTPKTPQEQGLGKVGLTALNALTLEIYYRYARVLK